MTLTDATSRYIRYTDEHAPYTLVQHESDREYEYLTDAEYNACTDVRWSIQCDYDVLFGANNEVDYDNDEELNHAVYASLLQLECGKGEY